MNAIAQGPESAPQLGNDDKFGATLKKANNSPNATQTFTDIQIKSLPPGQEQSSTGHREKPSLVCLACIHRLSPDNVVLITILSRP